MMTSTTLMLAVLLLSVVDCWLLELWTDAFIIIDIYIYMQREK